MNTTMNISTIMPTLYPTFNGTSILVHNTISYSPNVNYTTAAVSNFTNATFPTNSTSANQPLKIMPAGIVKALSVSLLIIMAVFGNLLVCISFAVFRNLRSLTNYFILSLSIADLLTASLVMPIWFGVQLYDSQWPSYLEQPVLLRVWHGMDLFFSISGIFSLSAISVERNLAITNPFCYTKWLSTERVLIVIAALWSTALAVAVTSAIRVIKNKLALVLFILIPAYVLPFLIMLLMYAKIFIVARRQARRLRQDGALATDLKAMKTIAIVVGAYLVCYTPNFMIVIWMHFNLHPHVTDDVVSIARWLTYLNSCLNPIIYSCFNKTYRKAFKRLLKSCGKTIQEFHRNNSTSGKMTASKTMQSRTSLNITMRSSAGSLLDGPRITNMESIAPDGHSRNSAVCNRISQASINDVVNDEDKQPEEVKEPVAETEQ